MVHHFYSTKSTWKKTMKKILALLLMIISSLLCPLQIHAETLEQVFIYNYKKLWNNTSGGGSFLENTLPYISMLEDFIRENKIQSVVDAGCGDWLVSKCINWEGIQYFGYDVVGYLIDTNEKLYAKPNVVFIHADFTQTELPEADLLICKDVLQHLSNADIQKFLEQLPKFKHCLITNDVDINTLTSENNDIRSGGYRCLDLTQSPFKLKGVKILTYRCQHNMKQVLYISR
jgi:SAM-dependent methyltransferase